jgi:NitT/TauT family transport system ATP-binding protein
LKSDFGSTPKSDFFSTGLGSFQTVERLPTKRSKRPKQEWEESTNTMIKEYEKASPVDRIPTYSGPRLQVNGIQKIFNDRKRGVLLVLNDVTFEVQQGEFLAIVGASGCGKTTLLRIIAGLTKPTRGLVMMDGSPVNTINVKAGYLSQAESLLPWKTVLGNVELGLEMRSIKGKDRTEIAQQLLGRVGLMKFAHSYIYELSGGMKKRVAFARLLAYDPEIFLMDEPFGALDIQTRETLESDFLKIWEDTRKTVVLVTHDLSEAITLADRIILMTSLPGTVKNEYQISIPRPRTAIETRFSVDVLNLQKRISIDLSDEVLKYSLAELAN